LTEKRYVVLDLFVIRAITSDDLNLYFRTGALLQRIKDRCHKIVLTSSLKKEYNRRLKDLKRRGFTNERLFKYLKKILVDSEKVKEIPDPAYNISVEVPEKDLPIVKAALAKGSGTIIITTDKKHFIENTKLQRFLENHKIKVLLLEEALSEIN